MIRLPVHGLRRTAELARRWPMTAMLFVFSATATLWVLWGCHAQASPTVARPAKPPLPPVYVTQIRQEPVVRVRLAALATSVSITSARPITISANGQRATIASPVKVSFAERTLRINDRAQPPGPITLTPAPEESLSLDGTSYPRTLVLLARPEYGGFDVVNHVGIEAYLPGVLTHELYAKWHEATFRAQAIAARSYALAMLGRAGERHFDLESDVDSQMYGGASASAKARLAVEQTRGLVLTWQGRILPAYYSACSGGIGQDAAIAFDDGPDLPPLRGRYQGLWGKSCRYFRWGPITRDLPDLTQRLRAWGAANQHAIAGLTSIASISVDATNLAGRPARFAITDAAGKTWLIEPEFFRFACNFTGPRTAPLDKTQLLRSSHVQVRVDNGQVHFTDGRGFGHGVGLDQWGAEAMANDGKDAPTILGEYYPGAEIVRLYE